MQAAEFEAEQKLAKIKEEQTTIVDELPLGGTTSIESSRLAPNIKSNLTVSQQINFPSPFHRSSPPVHERMIPSFVAHQSQTVTMVTTPSGVMRYLVPSASSSGGLQLLALQQSRQRFSIYGGDQQPALVPRLQSSASMGRTVAIPNRFIQPSLHCETQRLPVLPGRSLSRLCSSASSPVLMNSQFLIDTNTGHVMSTILPSTPSQPVIKDELTNKDVSRLWANGDIDFKKMSESGPGLKVTTRHRGVIINITQHL